MVGDWASSFWRVATYSCWQFAASASAAIKLLNLKLKSFKIENKSTTTLIHR